MKKNTDLLHGKIFRFLTGLAFPTTAMSLVQTVYNLTDMVWIGMVAVFYIHP